MMIKNIRMASSLVLLSMCAQSFAIMPFPITIKTKEEADNFIVAREASMKELKDLLGSIRLGLDGLISRDESMKNQESLDSIARSLQNARAPRYLVPPVKIAADASMSEAEQADFMRSKDQLIKKVSDNLKKIDAYEAKAKKLAKRLRLKYPEGPQVRY